MNNALHWGDSLNLAPLKWMVLAAGAVLATRLLTIGFYRHRILKKIAGANEREVAEVLKSYFSSGRQVVPATVSTMYFLCGCGLLVSSIWGLVATAWWALPLGLLFWVIVHRPFHKVMESWAQVQRIGTIYANTAILTGGSQTTEVKDHAWKLLAMLFVGLFILSIVLGCLCVAFPDNSAPEVLFRIMNIPAAIATYLFALATNHFPSAEGDDDSVRIKWGVLTLFSSISALCWTAVVGLALRKRK